MADEPFQVDLTNCDREPIHRLGTIQPFGFLVAITRDWLVAHASRNTRDFMGRPAEDLIGRSVEELIRPAALHELRNRMTLLTGADSVERIFGLSVFPDRDDPYDCALHIAGDHIILECEPSHPDAPLDPAALIRSMMARLDHAADLPAFLREGARQVRALTGIDRVMVYRFDRDGSGEVVAEAARSGIGSFLNLHYPASDIPRQARELYLRTPFRIIHDIAAQPSPIDPPGDATGEPIDLSLSVLRSVSTIHIEYLRNMGVGASLSVSIIIGGRLWGLFACHHYGPHLPSFNRRTLAELFGHMFALKLESRERSESATYESRARGATDRLLTALAADPALFENPARIGDLVRDTIACDGLVICIAGRVASSGSTPPAGFIKTLARRLSAMTPGRVFATDHLVGLLPEAEAFASEASGLLALPISRVPGDYVMLFRHERIRKVDWAGDPHKPASYGPHGARLTPRASFAAWSEEVRCRSVPFSDAELRVAEGLRASLIEVVLRMSDDARAERHRASERQELLIAELNHRVRNILALIRGLVRQSRGSEAGSAEYIALLEGRIEALARAHDQVTQDNWAPARLQTLFETEAAAYLEGRTDRLLCSGPPVLLAPAAFTTFALVVHELVTNSVKYGSLSAAGEVQVRWEVDRGGDLSLQWREIGGPPVTAPTRQGFGTTIIQRSIPYDLGGRAEIDYRLTGLEARFAIPARYVALGEGGAATGDSLEIAGHADALALDGAVLLVEDSLIIAMDAEDILTRLGAAKVLTAASVATALDEIDRERPAIAVLDVNLGSETSIAVADRLRDAGVPYLFATGYGEQLNLPAEHEGVGILQKPYTSAALLRALRQTLEVR